MAGNNGSNDLQIDRITAQNGCVDYLEVNNLHIQGSVQAASVYQGELAGIVSLDNGRMTIVDLLDLVESMAGQIAALQQKLAELGCRENQCADEIAILFS